MKLTVAAIGRLKAGPERELAARYLDRIAKAGPAVGIEAGRVVELSESRAGQAATRKREEAEAIRKALSSDARLILLDEKGDALSSEEFATLLARHRDGGLRELAVVIGGADGLDPDLRREALGRVAFGRMTWPHQIVRILLAEQLYRAVTILSGHPYHRA